MLLHRLNFLRIASSALLCTVPESRPAGQRCPVKPPQAVRALKRAAKEGASQEQKPSRMTKLRQICRQVYTTQLVRGKKKKQKKTCTSSNCKDVPLRRLILSLTNPRKLTLQGDQKIEKKKKKNIRQRSAGMKTSPVNPGEKTELTSPFSKVR